MINSHTLKNTLDLPLDFTLDRHQGESAFNFSILLTISPAPRLTPLSQRMFLEWGQSRGRLLIFSKEFL